MTAAKLAKLLVLALWPLSSGIAAEVDEAPEEIVVVGRLPGPPLWKVSNGENVLWIFPYLEWIPKDMLWDSERVARVIAESQEALSLPETDVDVAKHLLLNPLVQMRGVRFVNRLERNPDGGTLEDNLPPELYARFAALQARYFPGNRNILEERPRVAAQRMGFIIREREGLVRGNDILKTIQRLLRRNRDIKHTEIAVEVKIDNYRDYTSSLKALVESYPPELERACFEQQVRYMEEGLGEVKRRANNWVEGYIDRFRNVAFDAPNACAELVTGIASPERENMARRTAQLNQAWLDAAENALATNVSTFAILPINDLLAEDGLLSRLKAQGYDVREP